MDLSAFIRRRGDFLDGSFFQLGADGTFSTIDPSTGQALDEVPYRVASVAEAVPLARAAAEPWGAAPVGLKLQMVRRFQAQLVERCVRLAPLISREMGKPLWEARLECAAANRAIDLLVARSQDLLTSTHDDKVGGTARRRPVGVVAAFTPVPYPVYQAVMMIMPLLLGGNAVVWKPSSQVPLSSQTLAECFDTARFPRGVFAMVQGPRSPVGRALLEHPDVDMVTGAGDAEFAARLRRSAESRSQRSWAQAGGKGWAIVTADADLDRAAYEVVTGAFLTGGQRCNATSRVLVERPVMDSLMRRIEALTDNLRLGPPLEGAVFSGPLVSQTARRRFLRITRDYAAAGVQMPKAGSIDDLPSRLRSRGSCFVPPAVARWDDEALPAKLIPPEEIEGPLLLATAVDDAQEAVDRYNAHPYGLAAAVFTNDSERFRGLVSGLRAGAVNWNRGTIVASARYPNVALKRSGLGTGGNLDLLLASTYLQATLEARGAFVPTQRVPGMAWPGELPGSDAEDDTLPEVVVADVGAWEREETEETITVIEAVSEWDDPD